MQDTLSYTGQPEQAAHQISFHPTDANLLCSLGTDGLSLWSIDVLRSQDEMRHVPVHMPGQSLPCSSGRDTLAKHRASFASQSHRTQAACDRPVLTARPQSIAASMKETGRD